MRGGGVRPRSVDSRPRVSGIGALPRTFPMVLWTISVLPGPAGRRSTICGPTRWRSQIRTTRPDRLRAKITSVPWTITYVADRSGPLRVSNRAADSPVPGRPRPRCLAGEFTKYCRLSKVERHRFILSGHGRRHRAHVIHLGSPASRGERPAAAQARQRACSATVTWSAPRHESLLENPSTSKGPLLTAALARALQFAGSQGHARPRHVPEELSERLTKRSFAVRFGYTFDRTRNSS